MASGNGGSDVQDVGIPKSPSRRFNQTGFGIGEIPFFLDVPANVDLDDLEDRERALEELEREMKP